MPGSAFEKLVDMQFSAFAEYQQAWLRPWSGPRPAGTQVKDAQVGATPHDVVYQEGKLRLLRYRRETPAKFVEPLLICYALVNRPYILDLQPGRSVVHEYVARGFDVYLIDWGVPDDDDKNLNLEHYVCGCLANVVDFVLRQHDRQSLHLLGYCMGGTMSSMFTALYPERIKTLQLLAAPIDFAGKDSLLHLWTDSKYFDVDALIDAYGNCPANFLQTSFQMMKPVQNYVEKYLSFFDQMDNPSFVKNFFAMEQWGNDNIPVAGETFREFVKKLYQANELVRGVFHLGDRRVDLGRITCPLLLLTATHDHLVSPASTQGIRPHVGSRDVASMTIDAGHVGLVVSSKAHKSLWVEATRWLADRAGSLAGTPQVASDPV